MRSTRRMPGSAGIHPASGDHCGRSSAARAPAQEPLCEALSSNESTDVAVA